MKRISYLCGACHWSVTGYGLAGCVCAECNCGNRYTPKTEEDKCREFRKLVADGILPRNLSIGVEKVLFETHPDVHKVIFNAPATIVIWANGEKTVVKCKKGEVYDPEKGLAMAIAKHALGNQGNYYDVFKKWVPKKEERPEHKWVRIDGDFDTYHQCSVCHYDVTTPTPYCPECGAKMSVEEPKTEEPCGAKMSVEQSKTEKPCGAWLPVHERYSPVTLTKYIAYRCSVCGFEIEDELELIQDSAHCNARCPGCGAKMSVEES